MVVDDEADLADLVAEALAEMDYDCKTTDDVQETEEVAAEHAALAKPSPRCPAVSQAFKSLPDLPPVIVPHAMLVLQVGKAVSDC